MKQFQLATIILLLCLMAFPVFLFAQNREKRDKKYKRRPKINISEGVVVNHDVTYSKIGDRALSLDIYLHEETMKPAPVIVWIHGGGWKGGSKKGVRSALPAVKR